MASATTSVDMRVSSPTRGNYASSTPKEMMAMSPRSNYLATQLAILRGAQNLQAEKEAAVAAKAALMEAGIGGGGLTSSRSVIATGRNGLGGGTQRARSPVRSPTRAALNLSSPTSLRSPTTPLSRFLHNSSITTPSRVEHSFHSSVEMPQSRSHVRSPVSSVFGDLEDSFMSQVRVRSPTRTTSMSMLHRGGGEGVTRTTQSTTQGTQQQRRSTLTHSVTSTHQHFPTMSPTRRVGGFPASGVGSRAGGYSTTSAFFHQSQEVGGGLSGLWGDRASLEGDAHVPAGIAGRGGIPGTRSRSTVFMPVRGSRAPSVGARGLRPVASQQDEGRAEAEDSLRSFSYLNRRSASFSTSMGAGGLRRAAEGDTGVRVEVGSGVGSYVSVEERTAAASSYVPLELRRRRTFSSSSGMGSTSSSKDISQAYATSQALAGDDDEVGIGSLGVASLVANLISVHARTKAVALAARRAERDLREEERTRVSASVTTRASITNVGKGIDGGDATSTSISVNTTGGAGVQKISSPASVLNLLSTTASRSRSPTSSAIVARVGVSSPSRAASVVVSPLRMASTVTRAEARGTERRESASFIHQSPSRVARALSGDSAFANGAFTRNAGSQIGSHTSRALEALRARASPPPAASPRVNVSVTHQANQIRSSARSPTGRTSRVFDGNGVEQTPLELLMDRAGLANGIVGRTSGGVREEEVFGVGDFGERENRNFRQSFSSEISSTHSKTFERNLLTHTSGGGGATLGTSMTAKSPSATRAVLSVATSYANAHLHANLNTSPTLGPRTPAREVPRTPEWNFQSPQAVTRGGVSPTFSGVGVGRAALFEGDRSPLRVSLGQGAGSPSLLLPSPSSSTAVIVLEGRGRVSEAYLGEDGSGVHITTRSM